MSDIAQRILVGSIQKFSTEDGPGIRTTVFFKGCPLNCKWCHNPEMIQVSQELMQLPNNCIECGCCLEVCPRKAIKLEANKRITIDRSKCDVCLKCASICTARALRPVAKAMTIEEILDICVQDKDFYNHTGGGITLSGGEILLHSNFLITLIGEAKKMGMNVCLDTCGYGCIENLMEMEKKENVTDILYDLKAINDEVHEQYTGVGNKLIIENLKKLAANKRIREKLTIRMPLIGGVNDHMKMIIDAGELLAEMGVTRVNLLPYHDLGTSKRRNIGGCQDKFHAPTEERLDEIEDYFKKIKGLNVTILGRI